ncbi:MAG TPA: nitronate monooxygenase [Candidatus Acidoferrum sp.]|nr:nitronate monooxygenase [Candidatus Acidoferrum sp.]
MATPSSIRFSERLKIQHPIIQAPMAGGGDTPDLVAAVSNAGGLGFFGAAYLSPLQIAEFAETVRSKTSRPFGVNLFAPTPAPPADLSLDEPLERLVPYYSELGLPTPLAPLKPDFGFAEQLAAALETGASAFSFTFGIIPAEAIAAIKAQGIFLMGTATTVAEAVELEKAGLHAVVTQGSEGGGHRGTFSGDFSAGMIGTMALVPQVVDAVGVPVIASGGIMDGRGIAAALALGASAVQLGTAFLTCKEAGIPEAYKQAITSAREDQTRVTRAFSGRPARGIINRFMTEMESSEEAERKIPPFPVQNALTRPLRSAAGKQGRAEFLSLWAGQGMRLAKRQSAGDLMARLVQETEEAIRKLQASGPLENRKAKTGRATN